MNLSDTDLQAIRTITREENMALESDVREIYRMLAKMRRGMITDEGFRKLSLKDKLLTLNAELLAVSKQAHITLPR